MQLQPQLQGGGAAAAAAAAASALVGPARTPTRLKRRWLLSPGQLLKRPRAEMSFDAMMRSMDTKNNNSGSSSGSSSSSSGSGDCCTGGSNATTTRESAASIAISKRKSSSSSSSSSSSAKKEAAAAADDADDCRSCRSCSSSSSSAVAAGRGTSSPPPARSAIMMDWRARVNVQFAVTERRLTDALQAAGLSAGAQRANVAALLVMLLVACPDMVDAQVVALAMLYLDRFTCLGGVVVAASADPAAVSPSTAAAATKVAVAAEYYHAAAACAALALKWHRLAAADDLVGTPRDPPERFNRLIEIFQVSRSVRLTPARLGAMQMRVCALLGFDMWMGTAADWIALARGTRACALACDCEGGGGGGGAECGRDSESGEIIWPPMCWPQREPAEASEDMLPRAADAAAALARLPLEERVLLHALREPALVAWTPCRLGTACLTLAAACGAPGLPSPARIEAARMDTMPTQRGPRCPTTAKDAAALHARLVARDANGAMGGASAAIAARVPSPFGPADRFDPAVLARAPLLAAASSSKSSSTNENRQPGRPPVV